MSGAGTRERVVAGDSAKQRFDRGTRGSSDLEPTTRGKTVPAPRDLAADLCKIVDAAWPPASNRICRQPGVVAMSGYPFDRALPA